VDNTIFIVTYTKKVFFSKIQKSFDLGPVLPLPWSFGSNRLLADQAKSFVSH